MATTRVAWRRWHEIVDVCTRWVDLASYDDIAMFVFEAINRGLVFVVIDLGVLLGNWKAHWFVGFPVRLLTGTVALGGVFARAA